MQRHWKLVFTILLFLGAICPATDVQAQSPKPLASGVLKKIPTNLDPRDSFSLPMPLLGLKAEEYTPKYLSTNDTLFGQSQRVVMFRDVWQYEFSFVGQLRQARVLVPDLKTGNTQPRNVWYMLYRIRDFGNTLTYEQIKQSPDFDHIKYDLRKDEGIAAEKKFFLPRFALEGWVVSHSKDRYQKVAYRDVVDPMVLRQIQRREDPAIKLHDPVSISRSKIPLAKSDADEGIWGVAVFENVDPRIDYVSVYVSGLTNAFRIGRNSQQKNQQKTLQLNFWRPGDMIAQDRDDIKYGIPLVDNPQKQALICQKYNLPGPLLRVYHVNRVAANRKVLVAEADAEVSLKDFTSAITPELEKGELPASIVQALADSGIDVNPGNSVTSLVPGQRWKLKEGDEEYIIAFEPQFWERYEEGIRFIKSLDHLWIYR